MTTSTPLHRCFGDAGRLRPHWGVSPLVVRRSERGDEWSFDDVLSVDRLDEWLAMAARTPSVRLVGDGTVVDPARYCTPTRLGGRTLYDVIDPCKVARLFADGTTIVAQSLHRSMASVAWFAEGLQRELTHPVQANAYLSPPSATGLALHADRHDVIVIQIHGSKSWWVHGLGDVVLEPGDVMYVPLGVGHRASTCDQVSLHLTLGVIRVTARQLLERLVGSGPDALDDPLPIGYRNPEHLDELVDVVADALDAALDLVGRADLIAAAESEQERRLRPLTAVGRVASIAGVHDLDLDGVIRWMRPDPPSRIVGSDVPSAGRRVEVRLDDRVLSFPVTALAALVQLGVGTPTRVRELRGLDEPSRLVLARRLVREGACVVESLAVSPPAGSGSTVARSYDDNEEVSVSGEKDKATGRVKQAAGDLTGNRDLEREGEKDESAGKAKEAVGKAKDKLDDAIDSVKDRSK
jgi:uncharacterized protein YjbJ (UPF0337 family)/mannose-6-phosphate isomerase-like protein (cupin superfamily)